MTTALRSRRTAATAVLACWVTALASSCAPAGDPPAATPSTPPSPSAPPSPSSSGGATADPDQGLEPTDPDAYAERVFDGTNAVRADEGLAPLAPSSCAREAAVGRAADLVGQEGLEHAHLQPVLDACAPVTQAAENLSRAAATPERVVEAWLGSPGHRANLLSETLTQLGVGCVPDDGAMLCSQVYLGP